MPDEVLTTTEAVDDDMQSQADSTENSDWSDKVDTGDKTGDGAEDSAEDSLQPDTEDPQLQAMKTLIQAKLKTSRNTYAPRSVLLLTQAPAAGRCCAPCKTAIGTDQDKLRKLLI